MTFVCLHGAGKSRIAAALFNDAAAPGWHATSAGLKPQEQPSQAAAAMLSGDPAAAHLEHHQPQAMPGGGARLIVAIDCDIAGTERWDLDHEWPDPEVLGELRTLTASLVTRLEQQTRDH